VAAVCEHGSDVSRFHRGRGILFLTVENYKILDGSRASRSKVC
jgi:hypothetical protein